MTDRPLKPYDSKQIGASEHTSNPPRSMTEIGDIIPLCHTPRGYGVHINTACTKAFDELINRGNRLISNPIKSRGLTERRPLFIFQKDSAVTKQAPDRRDTGLEKRGTDILRAGGDLLFRVLRQSTIGGEGFHFRVREGIECFTSPRTTGSKNVRSF